MKYTIRENKQYSLWDLILGMVPVKGVVLENIYERVVYTGTARTALKIILDFFKSNGQIENKNTEIIVSRWLCTSVYHTIHKVCFPVLTPTTHTKGIIIYHQYGFPQNMDEILNIAEHNKWFIIENCVNLYESYYKGKRLGTFGAAAIFSLSKMFPSIQGGALVSNNDSLWVYAKNAVNRNHEYFTSFVAHLSRVISEHGNHPFWQKIQEMIYGRIDFSKKISPLSLTIARREIKRDAMKRRKENYLFLLDSFKDYDFFQKLERDIIPFVVPLIAEEEVLQKIKNKFLSLRIWTDIHNFDINRNLLSPQFKRCVWIPVHQGLTKLEMERLCKLIRSTL